uniref:Uncharacterized protein n=1 Tax=Thermofilum adornatum TaxID=1365176 RepID=A0A7C1CEM0_9CREN
MSNCYRCEDDRTRGDVKAGQLKKCVVCGIPAVYELDDKPYCLQHYAQVPAKTSPDSRGETGKAQAQTRTKKATAISGGRHHWIAQLCPGQPLDRYTFKETLNEKFFSLPQPYMVEVTMSAKTRLISEREAYDYIRQRAQEYVDRSVNRKGARYVASRLAISLFLAGLPMTVANYFEPFQRGDLVVVPVKRPRSFIHEYVVTPEEVRNIRMLIEEAKKFYSDRSLERVLQDEKKRFLEYAGIENITSLDAYALKLKNLGLGQLLRGRYPLRRLEIILAYIAQTMERSTHE